VQSTYGTLSFAIAVSALAGCDGGESCSNIAGEWGITGACGEDVCTISQDGCATSFVCDNARGITGTVESDAVSWDGETGPGIPGSCEGTVNGNRIEGTCTVSGEVCEFAATRLTGGRSDAGNTRRDAGDPPIPDAGRDSGPEEDPDAGEVEECADFSGDWGISGTCGTDFCTVEQTGCATTFDCNSSTAARSGTVDGDTAMWEGRAGAEEGTCTATISDDTFSGTCTLEIGVTCTVMGTRVP
jgi:hypothetical protein